MHAHGRASFVDEFWLWTVPARTGAEARAARAAATVRYRVKVRIVMVLLRSDRREGC